MGKKNETLSTMTTNDFEIVGQIRPEIDGEYLYKRILIQRSADDDRYFGSFRCDADSDTLKFDTPEHARNAFHLLAYMDMDGNHFKFDNTDDAILYWDFLLKRMKEFAEWNQRGYCGDAIEMLPKSLRDDVPVLIKPNHIVRYVIMMAKLDYDCHKINNKR